MRGGGQAGACRGLVKEGGLDAGTVGSSASALTRFRSLALGGMSLADYGFYIIGGTGIVLLATQAVIHPTAFIQITIFGLADGAMYPLVAPGYTMVYAIIGLINLAHADPFPLSASIPPP